LSDPAVLGYSIAEISLAHGIPVGTAKCYAHRARKTLRRRLEAVETA
jgi:DNA-directed RNA polymerase specialized sigma24 family protein